MHLSLVFTDGATVSGSLDSYGCPIGRLQRIYTGRHLQVVIATSAVRRPEPASAGLPLWAGAALPSVAAKHTGTRPLRRECCISVEIPAMIYGMQFGFAYTFGPEKHPRKMFRSVVSTSLSGSGSRSAFIQAGLVIGTFSPVRHTCMCAKSD